VLLVGTSGGFALAGPVQLPGAVQPGHDRPLPSAVAPPDFDFSIEEPHRSAVPRAVDEIRFTLNDIRIVGAISIPAERFRSLYADLIGKQVSMTNIFDIAAAIEKEYRDAGYLLIRAYVPPQHVKDGVFTIKVVEGFVASVSVEGGKKATRARIKSFFDPVLRDRPLRKATIERALLLVNDVPGIAGTGTLRPSASTPGASDVVVTLVQPTATGGLSANNRGSRFSGIWAVTGTAAYNSIFGADQLDATLTAAPHALEQYNGELRYRTAIGDDGLLGSVSLSGQHGSPGATLGPFDIRTDSWAAGGRLTYPLERSRIETLSLDGGITFQDAIVNVLGSKVSHDTWRVADLAATYTRTDLFAGVFTSTIDLAQGLPILGATPDHSPDLSLDGRTTFTKLDGLVHYTNTIANHVSYAISGAGQYSFEPLIEGEQTLFGGTQIGRGYDPGAITGDSGLGGSFELRYDTRLPQYWIESLQPYVFFDAASVWNRSRGASAGIPLGDYTLESTGGGLRFWFPYNIYLDLEGARTLRAVPGSDNDQRATKFLMDVAVTF
jgi:hemolysin activation/secretion protein